MSIASRCMFPVLVGLLIASTASAHAQPITLSVAGRTAANPTIAAEGQFVAVAFSAATSSSMDVFLATSRDGGRTFATPTQVNVVAGDARVSGEEPPYVALVPRKGSTPDVVVVWTTRNGSTWKLVSARSTNGGRTFGASANVPGSEADGSRGWQSVAVDANGRVLVLWLDHRGMATADSTHKHGATASGQPMPKADPTERAGLSKVLFGSLDSKSALTVAQSVCYCCKTSLAATGSNVYAVWRHVFPGGQRDIAFSMSSDRGRAFSTPIRVGDDQWKFDGCPDNGPTIAVDLKRHVHVVWPTPVDGKDLSTMALFYAVSRDGRTFTERVRIPSRGMTSHPRMVLGVDGNPVVAWDEVVSGTRRLAMTRVRVDASGRATFVDLQAPDTGAGQWYPTVAAAAGGTLVAWVRQVDKGSVVAVGLVK
ncbi:MAG: hypothetical protein ABMA00_02665 [Gemmatimonas sp.]